MLKNCTAERPDLDLVVYVGKSTVLHDHFLLELHGGLILLLRRKHEETFIRLVIVIKIEDETVLLKLVIELSDLVLDLHADRPEVELRFGDDLYQSHITTRQS